MSEPVQIYTLSFTKLRTNERLARKIPTCCFTPTPSCISDPVTTILMVLYADYYEMLRWRHYRHDAATHNGHCVPADTPKEADDGEPGPQLEGTGGVDTS